jgi:predicted DCC family thiol-disulfide oxidoreductase YuxK
MPATVIYDSDCGICTTAKRTVEALDHFRTMRWVSQFSPEAAASGVPVEDMLGAVQWLGKGPRRHGYAALKRIAARLPLFWLAVTGLAWLSPWTLLAPAFFFSPLSNALGNRAYAWIARNRYRLPGSTCRPGSEPRTK